MSACPSCGETKHVYYAGSWCANCGWHKPRQTLSHANFGLDPHCEWCTTNERSP